MGEHALSFTEQEQLWKCLGGQLLSLETLGNFRAGENKTSQSSNLEIKGQRGDEPCQHISQAPGTKRKLSSYWRMDIILVLTYKLHAVANKCGVWLKLLRSSPYRLATTTPRKFP